MENCTSVYISQNLVLFIVTHYLVTLQILSAQRHPAHYFFDNLRKIKFNEKYPKVAIFAKAFMVIPSGRSALTFKSIENSYTYILNNHSKINALY